MKENDLNRLLEKMRSFCAWRERSEIEVRNKLQTLNVNERQVGQVIKQLIDEDYLNEDRFVASFTGGRFRLKKWGKMKISHALRKHNIKEELIHNSLHDMIDEEVYVESMKQLAFKKYSSLSDKDAYTRKALTLRYMYQKGYEPNEVEKILQEFKLD
ncbi:MAG: regulatory protein RecX [Cyclobacteriaceae bacterium]|nr:regulatory protein RecX [Cyclobacteriaceae bacterium]